MYVPQDRFEDTGEILLDDPLDLFDNVFLTEAHPIFSTVYRDAMTQRDVGIYQFMDDDETPMAEVSWLDPDSDELYIRTLSSNKIESEQVFSNDTGSKQYLPLYELHRPRFLDEQFHQQQKKLNLTHTMEMSNVVLGGFVERTLLNVALAGTWTTDTQGNEVFTPNPIEMGAGTVNAFTGVTITDQDGNQRVADPKIVYRDPVPTETFRVTADAVYRSLLKAAHQTHHLIAGETEISAKSREAAMADHVTSLLITKKRLDNMWLWLSQIILDYLQIFTDEYDDAELTIETTLDVGPISPDMMLTVLQLWNSHMITTETALSMIGIEKVQEEIAMLKQEVTQPTRYQRLLMLLNQATNDNNMGGGNYTVPKDVTSNKSIKASIDPDNVPGVSDPHPSVIR